MEQVQARKDAISTAMGKVIIQLPIRPSISWAFVRGRGCRPVRRTILPPSVLMTLLFALCSVVVWAQKSPGPPPAVNEIATESETRPQVHVGGQTCATCHPDPHDFGPAAKLSCEACHEPKQWGTLLPFDHTRASSRLEGTHKEMANALPCNQCHGISAKGVPLFSANSSLCSGCHSDQDPHGGQFTRSDNGPKDCSSCHIQKSWASQSFDHDCASFALTSSHRSVSCIKCHKEQKTQNGQTSRLYRGTPCDCLKCH
jgi:hypothetical protein